jgi:GcrA cell cycle regulator
MPASNWTAQDDDALRAAVADGKTSAEIAALIRRSRGAVTGRANRLGVKLPGRRKAASDIAVSATRKKNVRGGKVSLNKIAGLHAGNIANKRESRKGDPVFIDRFLARVHDAEPVKLEALQSGQCKFPIGDPRDDGFGFCGGPRFAGYPYCTSHCRISYVGFGCEAA